MHHGQDETQGNARPEDDGETVRGRETGGRVEGRRESRRQENEVNDGRAATRRAARVVARYTSPRREIMLDPFSEPKLRGAAAVAYGQEWRAAAIEEGLLHPDGTPNHVNCACTEEGNRRAAEQFHAAMSRAIRTTRRRVAERN
jgi:hypothetical protein